MHRSSILHCGRRQKTKSRAGRDFRLIIHHSTFIIASKKNLRSATLTIAILVFFIVLVLRPSLTRLFRLVLVRLLRLALPMLAGLTTLLALLLHIVCHKNVPPKKGEIG